MLLQMLELERRKISVRREERDGRGGRRRRGLFHERRDAHASERVLLPNVRLPDPDLDRRLLLEIRQRQLRRTSGLSTNVQDPTRLRVVAFRLRRDARVGFLRFFSPSRELARVWP